MAATAMSGAVPSGNGFTLIELLIAVAIISILATVAYPQYSEYMKKARRSEIAAVLVEEAQKLERFYSRAGQYSNTAGSPALEHTVSPGNAYYSISAERSDQTFMLVAIPVREALMGRDRCGEFVLHHTGRRDNVGMLGNASVQACWGG